jgi:peptide/nickel transport system substrate-binding protein
MNRTSIDHLVDQLSRGELSRRSFVRRATALGLSAAAAGSLVRMASAQSTPAASPEASPAAYSGPTGVLSPSREEYQAALKEHFQFSEPEQTGGDLIVAQISDITIVNPLLISDTYSNWIAGFFNDGLVGQSPIDGTYVPGIADSWELGEDGKTYTFKLNPAVTWHDGTPFTADDVVFSFDATVAEDSLSVRRSDVLSVLDSYEKVDDHTVKLVAKDIMATFPFFDKTVGQVAMVPKHIWEGVKFADWGSDPGSTGADPKRVIGTGPFKFVEWKQNENVTLEKNPDYWDKENTPVAIDRFIYVVKPDAATAIQSLVTGESDITDIPFSQVKSLQQSNPELTITDFDTFSFNYYMVNQDASKSELFTDPKVRQALHYGLDRDLIAETVYQGFAVRADGTQPVLSAAYKPDQINTIYKLDVDKAKQLLSEAGWTDTDGDGIVDKDGVKFSFELMYAEGVATYQQQIPYMQQAWKEIGVEMIPAATPFPTLLDNTASGNFQCAVLGFSWSVDPDQGAMFRTDAVPPAGFNRMHYSNAEYDKLSDEQLRELDVDKRIDMIVEQTNIVNDEVAAGVIVFRKSIYGNGARVHNYFPVGFGEMWSIPYVWVES